MRLRFLPLFCLFLLSQTSLGQQQASEVPVENVTEGSPLEATGKVLVQETVAGNEVNSSWEGENVVAKNISNKPILLLICSIGAVGPRAGYEGGVAMIMDFFFHKRMLEPGDTFPLGMGETGLVGMVINPLDKARDPKAGFRVEFVQFLDGSTFGDPAIIAKEAFARRTTTLRALQKLDRTYSEQGEQEFRAQLEKELASPHHGGLWKIGETEEEKGTSAAISQVREMLGLAKEREATSTKLALASEQRRSKRTWRL